MRDKELESELSSFEKMNIPQMMQSWSFQNMAWVESKMAAKMLSIKTRSDWAETYSTFHVECQGSKCWQIQTDLTANCPDGKISQFQPANMNNHSTATVIMHHQSLITVLFLGSFIARKNKGFNPLLHSVHSKLFSIVIGYRSKTRLVQGVAG